MNMKETGRRHPGTLPNIRPTVMDRVVEYFSPVRGARRRKARLFLALTGGYTGGSKSRRSLKRWTPLGNDADSDILPDLPALRERSRDLSRNNPIATGAIATKVTNVVGSGFRLKSQVDRDFLGLDDEAADHLESTIEREWSLFWDTRECDAARSLTGSENTRLVYRQAKENGDVFILLPRIKRNGIPYDLRLQVVEADRVCNKDNEPDSETLAGGIRRDDAGAPVEYHILKQHPGNARYLKNAEWDTVDAYGEKTGLPNVIHLMRTLRPNQSRGVPDLAPVIEPLKQLGRYTDAELMATVISGFFTVFIETADGDTDLQLDDLSDETGAAASDSDYKLGNGAIIGLAQGEKISTANPGRPNTTFDPFFISIVRQIGVALELPFEILIKHFTASYSAARAAMVEAWKYFTSERKWLVDDFLKIVFEVWMYEAVASGRVPAAGYFNDPAVRRAYLGAEWIGPAKGHIDEQKEIGAAEKRVGMGISTLAEETAQLTGGDWDKKHRRRVKEQQARVEGGLTEPIGEEATP